MRKAIPIVRREFKSYSRPRDVLHGPLSPGLQQHRQNTYAVGFKEQIVSDEDWLDEHFRKLPIGFTGGLQK